MKRQIKITKSDKERLQKIISGLLQTDLDGKEHVRDLVAELDRADVVDPDQIPPNVITMNSKVLLSFGEPEEDITYSLVFPEDADISDNRLSILAPIGTAILGFREGDIIEWNVPDGIIMVTVKKVLYQPEAAGYFES
ncbi:MAG: nucleoside diphosphate kinase regulator [Christensenellales bacterium]